MGHFFGTKKINWRHRRKNGVKIKPTIERKKTTAKLVPAAWAASSSPGQIAKGLHACVTYSSKKGVVHEKVFFDSAKGRAARPAQSEI